MGRGRLADRLSPSQTYFSKTQDWKRKKSEQPYWTGMCGGSSQFELRTVMTLHTFLSSQFELRTRLKQVSKWKKNKLFQTIKYIPRGGFFDFVWKILHFRANYPQTSISLLGGGGLQDAFWQFYFVLYLFI